MSTTTITTFTDGLAGYWPFDYDYDDAAGSNDGTPVGSPSFVPSSIIQGISLTESDYINIGNVLNFGADDSFSLSAVFNILADNDNTSGALISKVTSTTIYGYTLNVIPLSGHVTIAIGDNSAIVTASSSPGSISKNTFYRATARINRITDIMDLFINQMGESFAPAHAANSDISAIGSLSTNDNLRIGRSHDDQLRYAGIIDDVRVYNRALTDLEVCALGAWPNKESGQCYWFGQEKTPESWTRQKPSQGG